MKRGYPTRRLGSMGFERRSRHSMDELTATATTVELELILVQQLDSFAE